MSNYDSDSDDITSPLCRALWTRSFLPQRVCVFYSVEEENGDDGVKGVKSETSETIR